MNCRDSLIDWIHHNFDLKKSSSITFIYDHMESQSDGSLPVIYQPFDPRKPGHIADRAQILDYGFSVGDGNILDFGPGDGWPSLGLAPMVKNVTGIDASTKRVRECIRNAKRLNVSNTSFIHVPDGTLFPFTEASFDGIVAATSIEQSADPRFTLKELYRVLKPGGKLRMSYEALSRYAGKNNELWLLKSGNKESRLILYDRHIDREYVQQYGLVLSLACDDVVRVFKKHGKRLTYEDATIPVLDDLHMYVREAVTWSNTHPSCKSYLSMLEQTGFSSVLPTYDGGRFIRRYMKNCARQLIFDDIEGVDTFLQPLIATIVAMECSPASTAGENDPWITATK